MREWVNPRRAESNEKLTTRKAELFYRVELSGSRQKTVLLETSRPLTHGPVLRWEVEKPIPEMSCRIQLD